MALNSCRSPKKIQDFKGIWTRDLAIPVRRSNQLSYEAVDVKNFSSWVENYSRQQ